MERALLVGLRRHPPQASASGHVRKASNDGKESKGHSRKASDEVPSDSALMSALLGRVTQLERAVKLRDDALAQRDKTIAKLTQLKHENSALKSRIHAMETFLNDYGLVWVGDDDEVEIEEEETVEAEAPTFTGNGPQVGLRVAELNVLAGAGTAEVVVGKQGERRMQVKEGMPFTLYSNGFLLGEGGSFRPFDSSEANRAFLTDIQDGYFPYELKESHPNGVPLHFVDRSERAWTEGVKFGGVGRSLADANVVGLSTIASKDPHASESADKFLRRLPKTVVHKGRVVEIREGISSMLQGRDAVKTDVKVVDTPVVQEMRHGETCDAHDVTTLQIRAPFLSQTLILKLKFDDTVGMIRDYIDTPTKYVLRTSFPKKTYTDETETLRSAGLVPNAAIMLDAITT